MRERTSYGELQPYAERVSRIPNHTYALSSPSSGADRAQRSEGIENVPAFVPNAYERASTPDAPRAALPDAAAHPHPSPEPAVPAADRGAV